MASTSTRFLMKVPDGTDTFDNELYLKGNLNIIDEKAALKKDVDELITKGSNGNGEFVKFADGTMICWYRASVTNQACDTAYGSLFTGSRDWTFPAPFISAPVVSIDEFRWGTGGSWGSLAGTPTSLKATLRIMDVSTRATGTATTIGAFAIGKWK